MKQTAVSRFSSWETAKRKAWINVGKLLLILLQTLTAALIWTGFYWRDGLPMTAAGCELAMGFYVLVLLLMCHIYDAFQVDAMEAGELAYSLTLAQFFTLFFLYLLVTCSLERLLPPGGFLLVLVVNGGLSVVWSVAVVRLHRKLFPPRRTYVICEDAESVQERRELSQLDWKFQLAAFLDIGQGVDRLLPRLADAEAVVLVDLHSGDRNRILKYCVNHQIQAYIRPKIGDLLLRGGSQLQLLNVPVVHCGRCHKGMTYLVIKRLMDIVLSGLALILLSPVMAVVAVLIRRYDGGPALYRQVRLTQDGREFEILKFRSMCVDAERDGVARLAEENDDRITPVGRFIRAVRLDELPQLINILKGDMSLVGPRPERPELAEEYEKELPEFRLRLQTKAGLTGYAQVYGKYNTQPYEKLQMDLLYIARQSVLLDLKLMFLTVKVLFRKDSTEGVERGKTTALR